MRKVLKWSLLACAILAAVALLFLYNPNLAKGPLERQLSALSGYPVDLRGDLDIDIGRTTELSLMDLHVLAPGWSQNQDLGVIGHLKLRLDLASLFSDKIVIESLHVDRLDINLEIDAQGKQNWVTGKQAEHDPGNETPTIVLLNEIYLRDATLVYLDQARELQHSAEIMSLTQQHLEDGMLAIDLKGGFNQRPVEFSASIGPYQNLLSGHDVVFSGHGLVENINIRTEGLLDALAQPQRPRFFLSIQGPDIDQVTTMLGIDDLGAGGFTLNVQAGAVADHYEASINSEMGNVSLNTSLVTDQLTSLDELELDINADGPNLGAFMSLLGMDDWPGEAFSLSGKAQRTGNTLNIPGLQLNVGSTVMTLDALLTNFPEFGASRARLSISGDDLAQFDQLLGRRGVATGPFKLRGRLDVSPDQVEFLEIALDTAFGSLMLSGTLGTGLGFNDSDLNLRIDGGNAHELMSIFDIHALPETPFSLDADTRITDDGVYLDRGILLTDLGGRLDLQGFISFERGGIGSEIQVNTSGEDLSAVLHKLVDQTTIPARPFDIGVRLHVLSEGIRIESLSADIAGTELTASGLLVPGKQFQGTAVNLQVRSVDISDLAGFEVLGEPLGTLKPGQPLEVNGQISITGTGWELSQLDGQIGETRFGIDALISLQADRDGSYIDFSVSGPGLDELLAGERGVVFPAGTFESSGKLNLSASTLRLEDFVFESPHTNARITLALGWPIVENVDATFDLDVSGNDIRNLLPPLDPFEPAGVAFHVTAAGSKQDNRFSLRRLVAEIGNTEARVENRPDGNTSDDSVRLDISLNSDDLSSLGLIDGRPLPAIAADLKTEFIGNFNEFSLENIDFKLGNSDISGILEIFMGPDRPVINLSLNSQVMDIRPFLGMADQEEEVEAETKREYLIPETPLPLATLGQADMTVSLGVNQLKYGPSSLENLKLSAQTIDGGLEVTDLSFQELQGSLQSSLSLVSVGTNKAAIAIDIVGKSVFLDLLETPDEEKSTLPVYDIALHVNGTGGTVRELAGSLDGTLFIGSDGGTLNNVNLSLLDTFVLDEVIGLILPKSKDDDGLNVSCFAAAVRFNDGLMRTEPAVALTTDKINLISEGLLNLKTEEIDYNFNATPTNALKISAGELFNPYILVSGTLLDPKVGLDPSKALLHGGAAIGTAGISIIAKGLIDRLGNANSLCRQIRQQSG